MKTRMIVLTLLAWSWVAWIPAVAAATLSPTEILIRSDKKRGNVDGISMVVRVESVEGKRTQKRTLRVRSRGHNALVEYSAPAKMKGTRILRLGRNTWIAKPGLRKPFAISSKQKMVGQAANGDVTSTDYAGDYRATAMTEVMLGTERCYLLDLKAAHAKVTYDRIRYWVSKSKLRAIRAEFLTVSGRLIKTATFAYENTLIMKGKSFEFLSRMAITDAVVEANITTLHYSKVRFKKHPDAVFNKNLLLR